MISPWFGVPAPTALASDFTVTSRLNEAIEFNDNFNLTSIAPSGVIGSYSTLSLSALHRTPTSRFAINSNISYSKYFGDAADTMASTHRLGDGTNVSYTASNKRGSAYVSAGYQRSDAAQTQREDLGTANISGDIINYNVGTGVSRQIGHTDSVSLSANWSKTSYSGGRGATPYTSSSVSGSWNHQVNRTINFNFTSSVSLSDYDNASQTETLSWNTGSGVNVTLTPRASLSANAGVVMYRTTKDAVATAVTSPDAPLDTAPTGTGTTFGINASAGFSYRLLKQTQLSLSASHGTSPGPLGDIATRTSFSASISHPINSLSNISLSGSYSIQGAADITGPIASASPGTSTNFISASASYNYRLTREMIAQVTYSYRQRNSDAGNASANSVLLSVSRDMTLKP